jgi:GNAT superfamily N-acetyltransferase
LIVELAPDDARLDEIYPVLHELRGELTPQQFRERYAEGHPDGYRVAALFDEGECRAVVGYRLLTNFIHGRVLYVDDLVTSAAHRSKGYGAQLDAYVRGLAEREGCERVTLDSGVGRARAHKFYFRQGYVVTSFHFGRSVDNVGRSVDNRDLPS